MVWPTLGSRTAKEQEQEPRSRQITIPAPYHSVFYRPDALPGLPPNQQRQSTEGTCYVNWNDLLNYFMHFEVSTVCTLDSAYTGADLGGPGTAAYFMLLLCV